MVALAFEEMCTPYASGQEVVYKKFGNTYQRKEIEKWMPHFQSTFTTKFIKWFSKLGVLLKWCRLSFHILAYVPWSFASCFVWDLLRPSPDFCIRCIASMILCTARFLCTIYMQKFVLMWLLLYIPGFLWEFGEEGWVPSWAEGDAC